MMRVKEFKEEKWGKIEKKVYNEEEFEGIKGFTLV